MEREWVSLNEFMKINHIGYETAKQMIANKTVEAQKIKGQYKIRLQKNAEVDKFMENLIRENEELKTRLRAIEHLVRV